MSYQENSPGCVVVNPANGNIIARSRDLRHIDPLHHSVMVAVDLVARSQGGGAYCLDGRRLRHSLILSKYFDILKNG